MEWIRVNDKLPSRQSGYERKNDILFYHLRDNEIRLGHFDGMCFVSNGEPYMATYWMPLPGVLKNEIPFATGQSGAKCSSACDNGHGGRDCVTVDGGDAPGTFDMEEIK